MKIVYMSSMTRSIIDNSHIPEWNVISLTIFFCFGDEKIYKLAFKKGYCDPGFGN